MEHFPHVHFVALVLRQWSRKLAVIRMIVGANCISSHQYLVGPRQPRPLICCTYIKIMNNNFPEEDAIGGGQIGVKSDRAETCFVATALPPFGPSALPTPAPSLHHSLPAGSSTAVLSRGPRASGRSCTPLISRISTYKPGPVCSGRCGDPSRAISWNCL